MRFNLYEAFKDTTMTGTTAVFSKPVFLENVYCFSFQHLPSAGSTPAGSLQLQATNYQGRDENGTAIPDGAWVNIDAAITIAGNGLVNKDGVAYRWIRFSYTPNSGVGTLSVLLNTKGT